VIFNSLKDNKLAYVKGKVMFSPGNGATGITKRMTIADGLKIAEEGISASHYYIEFMPRNETGKTI